MITFLSNLNCADNSGARFVQCIKLLGGSFHKRAYIGDIVVVAVKKAKVDKKVKKGEVRKGVIVRTKKPFQRSNQMSIGFDTNSVVLINAQKNPIGTRIFGPVTKELRKSGFVRIVSMAPSVI
uniref:Ribosomal protein L14 n=1 Tax=Tsukubamonas globosa TaxID=875863 RepID=W8VRA2_9EUKA|nr:ribosomal protein L14 [Tsukubamonas globosa]BAO51954.1 ribosomal protein L14 [Tsukubamonas globosa]